MEDRLKESMSEIIEMIKQGGEFAIEQAPIVVQELINWAIVSHSFYLLISLVLGYFAIRAGKNAIADLHKKNEDKEFIKRDERFKRIDSYDPTVKGIINYIVLAVGSISSIVLFFHNIYNLIQVLVAPRLYIIEYLKELI